VGLGKYLKKAFLYHWNLLVFLGGMGFALLSGQPDVFVPLVLAGETAYLGMVGAHPRFQKYVDAQEAKAGRREGSAVAEEAFQRILKTLPPRQVGRFEALRERCLALRQIAQQMRAPEDLSGGSEPLPFEELQLAGLDRLLWIHLRLLYTQHMLESFFERTSEDQIQREIQRLEDRIARMPREPSASPSRQGILKAFQDNLETCRARLVNLQKARDNSDLVEAEIEKLENKIRSITEMAINRQDPQFVTGQVDQVAESLVQTEKTMNELSFATGLDEVDDAIPSIIPRSGTIGAAIPRNDLEDDHWRPRRQREDEIQSS
jgi:hypothetical protein